MSHQYLKDKVKSLDFRKLKNNSGVSCKYYKLTKKYGVKFYCDERIRNEVVFRQKLAYNLGFAPKVLFLIKKGKKYGFITEHAKEGVSRRDLKKIHDFAYKILWDTSDLEEDRNVGMLNGKPVIIDFCQCTLGL